MIGIAVAVGSAGPAMAQRAGPYSPAARPEAHIEGNGAAAARHTLRQFGACLIKRSKREATRVAGVPVTAADYTKQWSGLVTYECLANGQLKIPHANLRGAVFEALFLSTYADANLSFSDETKSEFDTRSTIDAPAFAKTLMALERFGECVARRQSATVVTLLKSEPESEAEAAALVRLSPDFSACVPKDETFSFSKTVIRGALAEGTYWLSKAASS